MTLTSICRPALAGLALATAAVPSMAATYITPAFPSTAAKASYLRLHNPTAISGSATVTVRRVGLSDVLGVWTIAVPPGVSLQTPIRDIESAARLAPAAAHETYALAITATFDGFAQHVVWNAAAGSLTDVSNCGPASSADGVYAASVHTGLLAPYASTLVIYNTGLAPRAATLSIRDSQTGQILGAWTSPAVAAGAASRMFTATEILADARVIVGSGLTHVNLSLDAAFTGHLQHLSVDASGQMSDMTAKCNLTAGGAS